MQERMNADEPVPDHCGPACRSWEAAEARCGMLNEREQRINRHGNVGYFPDQKSRHAFFRGHPCEPYKTLIGRLLGTPLLRRPTAHETRDAAHQVLHAGIGRWLEGRAPLHIVQKTRGQEQRETVWRHDAVLLSSRWPYYYLFRDELRRLLDDRAKAQLSSSALSDDARSSSSREAELLPSPDATPEEALSELESSRASHEQLSALHAQVARLDPIGAAILSDPDYPDIDTARHAAALGAEYARLDALEGKSRSPRKPTPTDVTHRRHLAELRAAVASSDLLEKLAARHRSRSVREALALEERSTSVLSKLLQGYLRAYDREGIFDTFGLQRSLAAALGTGGGDLAELAQAGLGAAASGEAQALQIERGEGDAEDRRVRGKKLRASSRKLQRYVERVVQMLQPPIGGRSFGDALSTLRAHAFRPYDAKDPGPFTKLGLPASTSGAEGSSHEPLLTAASLAVLSGLLRLPERKMQPRNAVRLLNVLLRDFVVGFGPGESDEEGELP